MKDVLNKKARYEYYIENELEAGICLTGDEIKSVRAGKININGSYIKFLHHEIYLIGANIISDKIDPQRSRKLLLNKKELTELDNKVNQKGYTILPLKGYFKKSRFKLCIGLGRGKKTHDKRAVIKNRDLEREAKRAIKTDNGRSYKN